MSKREEIKAEIDKIAEDRLDHLHRLIAEFRLKPTSPDKRPILDKLRDIKIDGPVDFARNWNLYVSGEKNIEDNLP